MILITCGSPTTTNPQISKWFTYQVICWLLIWLRTIIYLYLKHYTISLVFWNLQPQVLQEQTHCHTIATCDSWSNLVLHTILLLQLEMLFDTKLGYTAQNIHTFPKGRLQSYNLVHTSEGMHPYSSICKMQKGEIKHALLILPTCQQHFLCLKAKETPLSTSLQHSCFRSDSIDLYLWTHTMSGDALRG